MSEQELLAPNPVDTPNGSDGSSDEEDGSVSSSPSEDSEDDD